MRNDIKKNFATVWQRIHFAENKYHREKNSVKLLAVSKGQPLEKIKNALALGQRDFAESYLQEALKKIEALKNESVEWHFIGNIQSNKTKAIAENFSWVHSISHLKIVERLNNQRPTFLPPLNICLEINIDQESSKTGILLDQTEAFARALSQMSRLQLRGLMCMPKLRADVEEQFLVFKKMQQLKEQLIHKGVPLDVLSMGTSDDFEMAIAAGSNWVRLGTLLFGGRVT